MSSAPQPLRLRVRYRAADGTLTGPLEFNDHPVSGERFPFRDPDSLRTYTPYGSWYVLGRTPRDLVADEFGVPTLCVGTRLPTLRDVAYEFVEAFENHPSDSVTVRRAFTQLRNTLKNP